MLEEGAAVDALDRAMTDFGFPVGPCTLLDEVGIDVAARVAGVMQRAFGDRMAPPASMAALLGDGRKGRKASRGFYSYDGSKKRVDESVYAVLPYGASRRPLDTHQTQERLVFSFLNEVVRCLQEGVLRSPRDGDVGAVFGLGFPPFLGRAVPPPRPPGRALRARDDGEAQDRARTPARRPGPGRPFGMFYRIPPIQAHRTTQDHRRGAREPQERPRAPGASHRGDVRGEAALHPAARQAPHARDPARTDAGVRGVPRPEAQRQAIRGRGANIFTQWVGDPDALGSAVLLDARSCTSSAPRRCASSPAASATPEPQPGGALRHHAARPQHGAPHARPQLHGGHLAAARACRTPRRCSR